MTQHIHTRLALGGFCLAYAGLMGGLLLWVCRSSKVTGCKFCCTGCYR
jgi:hypothetical protein